MDHVGAPIHVSEVIITRQNQDTRSINLVEFINRYIGASEPGLGTQPVTQNGTT